MTLELATNPPDQPPRALKVQHDVFQGLSMTLVWLKDGAYGVYSVFVDVYGEARAKAHLIGQCIKIAFTAGNREQVDLFVRLTDFLDVGPLATKNPEFHAFLSRYVEPTSTKGFPIPPGHAGSPAVQMAAALLATAIEADKAKQLAIETKQELGEVKQDVKSLGNSVADLQSLHAHGLNWRIAMVGLQLRGIKIPRNMRSKVGSEIAEIGRRLEYPVDTYINGTKSKYPEESVGDFYPLHYPSAVLNHIIAVWIKMYRNNLDRSSWFRDLRDQEQP